jgi:hypothetical protein
LNFAYQNTNNATQQAFRAFGKQLGTLRALLNSNQIALNDILTLDVPVNTPVHNHRLIDGL